jgi:protein-S-isoprenylcysteine O-methyltransferase Ste14
MLSNIWLNCFCNSCGFRNWLSYEGLILLLHSSPCEALFFDRAFLPRLAIFSKYFCIMVSWAGNSLATISSRKGNRTMVTLGNKLIFFGLFVGFIALRGIFGLIAQRSGLNASFENEPSSGQKEQKGNTVSIIIILCILASLVFYAVMPERRNILIVPLPDWMHWLGVTLGIISLALQIWTHLTLQKAWSAAKISGKNNVVITSGPYHWIRHPLYLALMLFFIGLSLVSGYSLFLLLAVLSIPFFNSTAKKEETVMLQQFGDEYREYMIVTGRFLPLRVFRTR